MTTSVAAIIAVAAGLLPAAPGPVVVVERAADVDACVAIETIAAAFRLTPGLRVSRAITGTRPLDEVRSAGGADYAVRAAPGTAGAIELSVASPGGVRRESVASATEGALFDAIGRLWSQPKLVLVPAFAAPNRQSLTLACAKDPSGAMAAAGAALGTAILGHLGDTPIPIERPERQAPLLYRWAAAQLARRSGDNRRAVTLLRQLVPDVRAGESAPTWRYRSATMPSAVTFFAGRAVVFDEGKLRAFDPARGTEAWTLDVGTADPTPIRIGPTTIAVATDTALVAIDATDGTVRWTAELRHPHPEIVRVGDTIFAAGSQEVVALRAVDGEILWRVDPVSTISAGPVVLGDRLAVPSDAFVLLLDPNSGHVRTLIDVGDEVAAPLFTTESSLVWSVVGGELIHVYDLGRILDESSAAIGKQSLAAQFDRLSGASWPPVRIAQDVLLATKTSRGASAIIYADASRPTKIARRLPGAEGPIRRLPDFSGAVHLERSARQVVARGPAGRVLWRYNAREAVRDLVVHKDAVWAVSERRVDAIDRRTGKRLSRVVFDEPIADFAVDEAGTVAVTASGAVYGLAPAADPRRAYWLSRMRFALAESYLAFGKPRHAAATAKEIARRDPTSVDAIALIAQVEGARNPAAAVARWSTIARESAPADPLQQLAQDSLRSLIGVTVRSSSKRAVGAVSTSSVGPLLIRRGTELSALDASTGAPMWNAPIPLSTTTVAADGGATVAIGTVLVATEDGRRTAVLPAAPRVVDGAVFTGSGDALVRHAADGARIWTRRFEFSGPRVIAASTTHAFVSDPGAAGIVHAIDLGTGAPRWMRALDKRVRDAAISGAICAVITDSEIVGLALADGTEAFRRPLAADARVVAIDGGWAVVSNRKIEVLGATGFVSASVALPKNTVAVGVSTQTREALVALDDGTVAALHLKRPRLGRRFKVGAVSTLVDGPDFVAAIGDGGQTVWVMSGNALLSRRQ